MNNNFIVRKAAVLGAGVMGAQIAAHLVNANVETLLFELPAKIMKLILRVSKKRLMDSATSTILLSSTSELSFKTPSLQ